ncbi:MAG: PKD domain-containing protein [Candidatus Poribacteria bacterium]
MFKFIKRIFIIALGLGLIIFIGCGDSTDNFPPEISVFESESRIIEPGEQVTINLTAVDVDNEKLTYTWSATGGTIEGSATKGTWIAPKKEGRYEIRVEVSDGTDFASKTMEILVWRPRPGDYYPLAIGNRWVLRDEKGNLITFEVIDKIKIENTDVETFIIEISNSDPELPEGFVNYSYVNKRPDGSGVDQHAASAAPGSADTLIFTPWLPLYNFPLIPGESWEVEFRVKLPEGFYVGDGKAKYEVIDEETVTVPAGTFEHVFSVRETFEWQLLGEKLDTTVSTKWLAPNVGIVMVEQEQTRGGQTVPSKLKLESFQLAQE